MKSKHWAPALQVGSRRALEAYRLHDSVLRVAEPVVVGVFLLEVNDEARHRPRGRHGALGWLDAALHAVHGDRGGHRRGKRLRDKRGNCCRRYRGAAEEGIRSDMRREEEALARLERGRRGARDRGDICGVQGHAVRFEKVQAVDGDPILRLVE